MPLKIDDQTSYHDVINAVSTDFGILLDRPTAERIIVASRGYFYEREVSASSPLGLLNYDEDQLFLVDESGTILISDLGVRFTHTNDWYSREDWNKLVLKWAMIGDQS